jgi:hypothetical protein
MIARAQPGRVHVVELCSADLRNSDGSRTRRKPRAGAIERRLRLLREILVSISDRGSGVGEMVNWSACPVYVRAHHM